MSRGGGAFVTIEINSKVAKNAHRQLAHGPAKFAGHIKNEETVDAGLITRSSAIDWIDKIRIAGEVLVKGVAVAGVVIDGRRKLKVNCFGKVNFRAELPAEHVGVGLRYAIGRWPERVLGIFVVVNELRKVGEEIDRDRARF